MRRTLTAFLASLACMLTTASAGGAPLAVGAQIVPLAQMAPTGRVAVQAAWRANPSGYSQACGPGPIHCYLPSDIREAYGVDQLDEMGEGQTIVLVDSYGDPMAAQELQEFYEMVAPADFPAPNFEQVFPVGKPDYSHANPYAQGNSGPGQNAAAGWAVEAALDVQWAYAIAPAAHIVLLAVPPAETLGVQGFPNLFKAMSWAVDHYPAGTIFSMSFGVPEQTFGGAAAVQTAKFDKVFQKGIAKGDSFFGASGDYGTTGWTKQQKGSRTYSFPTSGWPNSSPYVTAVGGTQLQFGWAWYPKSDVPITSDGDLNPAYFNSDDSPPGSSTPNLNVVWNESWLPAATGGGPSAIYSRPSWQDSVQGIVGNARGNPDISWNAAVNGGVLVDLQSFGLGGCCYIIGGTSAATPQIAGLTALVNERRHTNGDDPIGNLAPALYALGSSSTAFTDVTAHTQGTAASGVLDSNTLWDFNGLGVDVTPGPVSGWPTLPGWDMTTGFGTPSAPAFLSELGGP